MSKIYNIAFRIGVLFNVLLFTFLNLITFIETRNSHDGLENAGIAAFHSAWGFPFPMFSYPDFFIDGFVLIFNTVVYVTCGFFFGFLFKFVWSKISSRRVELK